VRVGALTCKPIEERIGALRAYPWSSYPSYIGRRKSLKFVQCGPLLAEMHGKRREWPKRYREFVESGLAEADEDFDAALKASPRSVGSDAFRAWIDDLHQKRVETHARPEDVSFRHTTKPLPAEDVLRIMGRSFGVEINEFNRRHRNSPLRAVAARFLIRYSGQSQRDVADLLNIGSGAAVCNQLKRLPAKLAKDRQLRRQIKRAEDLLSEKHSALINTPGKTQQVHRSSKNRG